MMLLALLSCKKDDIQVKYPIFNVEDIMLGITSVQVNVDYNYPSVLKTVTGFISANNDMSNSRQIEAAIYEKKFSLIFNDLLANTQYYYYYEYSVGVGELKQSDVLSFSTNDYDLPSITTTNVTSITAISAMCGGNVVGDGGGLPITNRGICWSTTENPTISNSHTTDGTGLGVFSSSLTALSENQTYYVRAYATNAKGTSYGDQKIFVATDITSIVYGLYSISPTKRVFFSQGNLKYQSTSNTWKFADNQYDCCGEDNLNCSSTSSLWFDLFGWGTSGYNHGAIYYHPWQCMSPIGGNQNYNAYGNNSYNLNDETGMADWGYNAIANGGNIENFWRTLSKDEWDYLVNIRNTVSGVRFAKACVNGRNGLILFPDNWINSIYDISYANTINSSYNSNALTKDIWNNSFQTNGVVFLPAAGMHVYTSDGNILDTSGNNGYYWSTTHADYYHSYGMLFTESNLYTDYQHFRERGCSVRLVYDVE